jgi:hypothetical protein
VTAPTDTGGGDDTIHRLEGDGGLPAADRPEEDGGRVHGGGRGSVLTAFRRHYGAGPLHLLSLLACFALSGYIVTAMYHAGHGERILVWFAGAILGHDLVLFPLYALADRSEGWLTARRHPQRLPAVPWINHVRVPVVLSFMLLAISFPLVLDWSNRSYHAATGLTLAPYEGRYLLIVAVLFAASAVLYAARLGRAVTLGRRSVAAEQPASPDGPRR